MHLPRRARPCRGEGGAAALAATPWLAACTESGTLGPWIYVTLASVALGVGAYLLGVWRTRAAAAQPAARSGAASAAESDSPPAADDGHASDEASPVAAALPALLAAIAAPALLALHDGRSWRVQGRNAAAQARWPTLAPHAEFDPAHAGLPQTLVAAVAASAPAAAAEGWQLTAVLQAGGRNGLLIVGPAAPAPVPADRGPANEIETLAYTVSHDLRAPIRVVEGFTRIVKEDYGRLLDRVGNDHLDRVLGAASRMNLMIDALLTLARLTTLPLERQPVNLSQMAGWVVDDLRRASQGRLVDVEIEPDLVAQGDPTLLRQVLENLLGNAWKYSAQRERSQITLRRVQRDGRSVFLVRDNGAGFDPRSADRLFGLFQRLHSASDFPGHGVGLASVRRIVQRHGGEIWAEAETGRGASFYFTLS